MLRIIISIFAVSTLLVLSDSRAMAFTEAQLIKYYGLKEAEICVKTMYVKNRSGIRQRKCVLYKKVSIPPERATFILPKAPPPFPLPLPQRSEILNKPALTLADEELDLIVRDAEKKINEFWGNVFSENGAEYRPPRLKIVTGDTGTSMYYEGTITIGRDEHRSKRTWHLATAASLKITVAHEFAHYIVELLQIDEPKMQRIKKAFAQTSPLTFGKRNPYPRNVFLEMQADYLGGATLRGTFLLHQDDPEEIYYSSAGDGNDFLDLRYTNKIPREFKSFQHPTGKDRAIATWEGMVYGDVKKGLELLGMKPQWHNLEKKFKKRSVR